MVDPRRTTAGAFVRQLRENGVMALALDKRIVRMVPHFDLPADSVERAVTAAGR